MDKLTENGGDPEAILLLFIPEVAQLGPSSVIQ